MFIETSAIVAILAGEADADTYLAAIDSATDRQTGAHVRLEATINLARILGLEVLDAQEMFDAFLHAAKITVIPITDTIARRAVEAFAAYGKGKGHPAQLNFADCLSYACADTHNMPILFKGRDFMETNLKSALFGAS
ncbi:ribonuclease VapC [Rhizobium sp. ERR 1071]|uniref:Twitching motility protein PilT n=1 Tax=Rhizobium dioscoreae TaxID=2653122 RepID=A0ABQ0ZDU4_9HYPH|nr:MULTISPECIES: type II toxin-antitoxin system VapC family toxin [Rhizobium]TWB12008.1 ribonuclease VapC [Rhizobium sp. ERR1071]GES53760.1 twitching motility protein PilT [Rhizobium dioscoreae]GLU85214.1 twitching motility protein PilT [Rhizobium sp. NBRC 114257]